jgi:predicted dehydrogenase
MPEQYSSALHALPDGASVLIQKPFGQDLADAAALLRICRQKRLIAAVNTQLRFAPYVRQARRLIASGAIGELIDVEVRVSVNTPWHLFPHVLGLPRLEINMHSVHYIDLIRSFLGDPDAVSAVTVGHPAKPNLSNTRSIILLRYAGRPVRAVVSTNHDHAFGQKYQESFIKWEGTDGAIRAQMGLLLDYPSGREDALEIADIERPEHGWAPSKFDGSWFPDAFADSMGALQAHAMDPSHGLPHSVDDVMRTMAVVEAAYESSRTEGVALANVMLPKSPEW